MLSRVAAQRKSNLVLVEKQAWHSKIQLQLFFSSQLSISTPPGFCSFEPKRHQSSESCRCTTRQSLRLSITRCRAAEPIADSSSSSMMAQPETEARPPPYPNQWYFATKMPARRICRDGLVPNSLTFAILRDHPNQKSISLTRSHLLASRFSSQKTKPKATRNFQCPIPAHHTEEGRVT